MRSSNSPLQAADIGGGGGGGPNLNLNLFVHLFSMVWFCMSNLNHQMNSTKKNK